MGIPSCLESGAFCKIVLKAHKHIILNETSICAIPNKEITFLIYKNKANRLIYIWNN